MSPPYMAVSHIDFKVEGVWEAGSGFWPPPYLPFFTETGHKTLLWEKACLYQRKENPCLWRQIDTKEDPIKLDFVSFPQFTAFTSYSLTCHIYYCPLFIKDFPGGSDGEESAYNTGDWSSIVGSGKSLQKEVATHSSILAWRIPWKRSLTMTNTFTLHQTA